MTGFLKSLRNSFLIILKKLQFALRKIFRFPHLRYESKSGKAKAGKKKIEANSELKMKNKLLLPSLSLKEKISLTPEIKKSLISVLLLILILAGGFFVFQKQEKKELEIKKGALSEIQKKISEAEKFLLIGDEEKSLILFKTGWEEILNLSQDEWPEKDKAISLKNSIEEKLKILSKLELVESPKVIFEFDQKIFIPQRIIYFQEDLYLFSILSEKLFKFNIQNKKINDFTLTEGATPSLATVFGNSILFFLKPDTILPFKNVNGSYKFENKILLQIPSPDSNFIRLASHQQSIYFLEEKTGEIIKFPSPFKQGQIWLKKEAKRMNDGKSIAIDGSIWLLKEGNIISQYSKGEYRSDLNFDFFPAPKAIQRIITSHQFSYLYLLEPSQNRVIIISKNGEILKQFQSNQFDNLKDLAISPDEKAIYLLNGQKIYELEI